MKNNLAANKERKIEHLNEMKEIISDLGVLEGNKYKDLKSIDEEIEKIQNSSLK